MLLAFVARAADAGTYAEPEITDPAGDASHNDFYTGKGSVDSFDLLRSWIAYDAASDAVDFTMHLVDASEWARADDADTLWCRETITLEVENKVMGELSFGWRRDAGSKAIYGYASFLRAGAEDALRIPSTNRTLLERPGNLTLSIQRAALAAHGQTLGHVEAVCELMSPLVAPQTGLLVGSADLANASIAFDLGGPSTTTLSQDEDQLPKGGEDASAAAVNATSAPRFLFVAGALVLGVVGASGGRRRRTGRTGQLLNGRVGPGQQ
jgi:hypothetical protein